MKRIKKKTINKMFIVYQMYCESNQKIYIGITNNFDGRLAVHWNDAKNKNTVLCRTIRKYGKDRFIISKIDSADSWDEACELEKEYIKKFNTRVPKGMNMTDGGDGVFGLHHSDKTRKQMKESHLGKGTGPENAMFGKPGMRLGKTNSPLHCKRISKSCKGRVPWNKGKKCPQLSGENNGFYGKHHSDKTKKILREKRVDFRHTEETKRKMSEDRKRENHPNWGKKFSSKLKSKLSNAHKNLPIEKKQGMAKLTEIKVLEIRRIFMDEKITQQKIADQFNLTQSNIHCIVKRKTWAHI